jgi:hypothetical protein
MNNLGAELVTRNHVGEVETRLFDSNYHGQPATISLRKEITPSKIKGETYYYQIILTLFPTAQKRN